MFWRSTAAMLLWSSAAAVLFASSAASAVAPSCLPSASAVREQYPGSWPSWTLRASGHQGVKCWYPSSSAAARDRQTDGARPQGATETASAARASTPSDRGHGPSLTTAATNGIGRGRDTLSPEDVAIRTPEGSSFAERFDALAVEGLFFSPDDDQGIEPAARNSR
jgi:hypothetical protein